ncbi:MAG TPA: CoB--CoM heterodisulfide reductase iron-sulfur subunit A family protein [Candidatus Syntrophoarchaeum butanivorans]|uniref:CoB--CoM heterodisulfide reductase iron-sulfur subunit A n=1 Tax=Candidatus Syntropharchaeum butanivorans TaxID=1839936 RepID=A0A1F2P5L9_9EURY|nr:MAG: heterodisulfide reductase [Candidatus Syntrophoarchaeum butanivorans]HEC56995.1 CoB--CoM heterodisulfide reductase iron-sulfur subunit A family protein [Candidatus Syntrophoarchaeum butanivorans]
MRILVFICGCQGRIEDVLDLDALSSFTSSIEDVEEVRIDRYLCGRDGIKLFKDEVERLNPDRVIIAGCSPRLHGEIFKKALEEVGMNPHLAEHVNIREQCAWAHFDDPEGANRKAKKLIEMGLAKVRLKRPLEKVQVEMKPQALVVGGGVAGMEAALNLSSSGFKVYLVEREKELGGRVKRLSQTFPTVGCGICCMHNCPECELTPQVEEVLSDENIEVLTSTTVEGVEGYIGNYHVTLTNGRAIDVSTVIIATGTQTFDPSRIPEYGYSLPDVITSLELEELYLKARQDGGDIRRPSDGAIPKRVNFIQCVGSRGIKGGNPYCSIVCCIYAVGHARELKMRYPDCEVTVHYIDLRSPYRGFEEYYKEARDMGVRFVRGEIDHIEEREDGIYVTGVDQDTREPYEMKSDLVVLSVGQEPTDGTRELADLFNLELDQDGFFMEKNLRYLRDDVSGVYVAGAAHGPRNIRYSVADGKIMAEAAIERIAPGRIELEGVISRIDDELCIRCATCFEVCPYGAVSIVRENEKEPRLVVIEGACRGCGICTAECPACAIQLEDFRDEQIMASVEVAI